METNTLDITKLSAADLKAELERREKEEKQNRIAARNQFEADKNNFAQFTSSKFLQLHSELQELKEYTITEANKLYNRMYEINDRDPKETKSFTLKNSDDTIKVTVERQERFEFTEEAAVHINAIKEIFKQKFEARHKGMYNLLDSLLIKSKGEYDPKLLAKARRQVRELGDEALINEFDKLDDCQKVIGSAMYCRLHVRDAKGKWDDVSLQFSSL